MGYFIAKQFVKTYQHEKYLTFNKRFIGSKNIINDPQETPPSFLPPVI
jgi:hypothetical protein